MVDSARAIAIGAFFVAAATACNAILGIVDVPAPPDGGAEAGSTDASSSPDARDSSVSQSTDAGDAGDATGPLADAAPDVAQGSSDSGTCDPAKTQDDPNNCGICGHDCLGGKCMIGACQPFVLFPTDGGPVVQPWNLAQDSAYLYWTESLVPGAVRRTDKTTGATSDLLPLDAGSTHPRGIAVDESAVYWGETNGLFRCAKAGCVGSPKLVSAGNTVYSVAIDDAGIYWGELGPQIFAANKLGTNETASVIWQGTPSTVNVATDGQRVYFTADDGMLHGVSVDGGNSFAVGTAGTFTSEGIALNGGVVYWTVADPANGEVLKAPTASLVASPPLITQQQSPYPVATDGTSLYWANVLSAGSGQIMTCATAACSQTNRVLANPAAPFAIVVDATAIYWTDKQAFGGSSGAIYKLAK